MQLNDIITQQSAAHDCHSRIFLSGLSRGGFWESSLKYHLYQEMTPISESWLSFSGNQNFRCRLLNCFPYRHFIHGPTEHVTDLLRHLEGYQRAKQPELTIDLRGNPFLWRHSQQLPGDVHFAISCPRSLFFYATNYFVHDLDDLAGNSFR